MWLQDVTAQGFLSDRPTQPCVEGAASETLAHLCHDRDSEWRYTTAVPFLYIIRLQSQRVLR